MKRTMVKALSISMFSFFVAASMTGAALAGSDIETNRGAISKLETIKESHLAGMRSEALQTKSPMPRTDKVTGPASAWLTKVSQSEVNMITNRHEKKAQNEIKMDGKTYFGSGEGIAWNLSQNPTVRFSKDPMTGRTIDKADAVIFADASGRVHYFESETTFRNFVNLATPETVFGYSEPK